MKIEEKLTLDILSESKNDKYQRRYNAVIRFIETFGFIPSIERMLRDLPKSEKITRNVSVPENLYADIEVYEKLLAENPGDIKVINALDKLYDSAYRQTNN